MDMHSRNECPTAVRDRQPQGQHDESEPGSAQIGIVVTILPKL